MCCGHTRIKCHLHLIMWQMEHFSCGKVKKRTAERKAGVNRQLSVSLGKISDKKNKQKFCNKVS